MGGILIETDSYSGYETIVDFFRNTPACLQVLVASVLALPNGLRCNLGDDVAKLPLPPSHVFEGMRIVNGRMVVFCNVAGLTVEYIHPQGVSKFSIQPLIMVS